MTDPSPHLDAAPRSASQCRWCGSPLDGTAKALTGRLRCASCGVANTYPFPADEQLEAAYSGFYRPPSGRFSGPGDALLRRSRGRLAARLDAIAPRGTVLDVGAGDGTLLDALHARGRRAVGLERQATRPDIRNGNIGDLDGAAELSAIVLWHSLEHLHNPGEALARACELLEPGGVLVVCVPNAGSLQARVFGDRWLALDLPRHLTHITARALVTRLRELTMEVERVSYWRGGQVVFGWLHGLVALLPGDMHLYDAIRRPQARGRCVSASKRRRTLAAGIAVAPVALLCSACEVALRCSGTVYIEARRGEAAEIDRSTQPRTPATRPPGRVIVVMPAMNAAVTVADTVASIPRDWVDEVILVDDHSTDATVEVARRLPVHVVWHPHNAGYGANQKTCYMEALRRGADAVVMLHPDGQYPPELIPAMVEPILTGRADLVLGSRLALPGMARRNGMPLWKYVSNRFLTIAENGVLGTRLTEAHTGFRAYSRHMLLTIPFLRNSLDFAFDSEVIMQAAHFGLRIEEVPAHCRYFEDMSSVGLRASAIYGAKTLWTALRLVLHRAGIWRSARFSRPGGGEPGR